MRLKQLFGILLLQMATGAILAASTSQLMDVGVQTKDNATTLTLRTSGVFQHTEYRPADNLLLVDLTGVSAAKLENRSRDLKGAYPGVSSYHVVGYKGANGSNITRLEMNLAADAVVSVHGSGHELALKVTSNTPISMAAAGARPMENDSKTDVTPAIQNLAVQTPVRAGKPVAIRNVSLVRGKNGYNIEISANGAIAPKLMKLTGPDRVVIDIPNSIPTSKQRQIAVHNGEIKGIRVAHYSLSPSSTRVVVDLASAHDFEVSTIANRTLVKLHEASALAAVKSGESVPAAVAVPVVAQQAMAATPDKSSQTAAQNRLVSQPTPAERAANAASKFRKNDSELPIVEANASLKPQPMNVALLQQPAAAAPATPAVMTSQTGSCGGNKYNGEPISVNLKDVDLRDFFRLIHDISGLNVVLDPQVKGSLTIVLDDVPWDQALQIVLKNNQLDCELQGNVLRIATTSTLKKEADDRRAQIDAQALAVEMNTINRPLSYAVAKDVVPTLKTFLSSRGSIIADDRTNALIISDIPSVLPNLDRLIKELDTKTKEVEIEARVVAANRSFARDIGTQLGFGWGNNQTAIGGGSAAGTSPVFAQPVPGVIQIGQPAAPTAGQPTQLVQIPLFSNLGAIGATSALTLLNEGRNYRVDAILTAAESRGLIKILSRPRVVTQNNMTAVVKQGVRVPIVTQAQLGGPPTTSYTDAFLRLTVKPQITAEGTIFLNVDVENTTADFSRQVQGNPTLVEQQATTQVLVTDGGTVVIGGVIQTNNNVAIQQVPLLGNIPVLGNLFKRRSVSTSVQELIFFITPRIVQT